MNAPVPSAHAVVEVGKGPHRGPLFWTMIGTQKHGSGEADRMAAQKWCDGWNACIAAIEAMAPAEEGRM